ncbi:uncharacterized protein NKAPD1 [Anolis sagrei]|uniref:uncharacterized protein NKAPD1 n=1 Tax=Anolis sagrei TaxID=38937 RepID=UPI003520DF98
MSHVPLGKVLLRNVIRHTGAHNKIQEESEMWKIREMEKQSKDIYWGKQPRMLPKSSSNRMRSDGFDEEQGNCKARNLASMSAAVDEDLRHARYWNKKLYEYEANMPDRWGHSGYRELYPEEFDTDSDGERNEQNSMNGKRKRHLGQQSSLDLPPRKKLKKSHKKKQKKKSHKKQKKKKRRREQPSTTPESSSESGPSEGEGGAQKRGRHKRTKKASALGSLSGQAENDSGKASSSSNPSSSSEDSGMEEKQKQRKKKKRRKHHSSVSERGRERVQEKRSKRKNWKVAADENSEDSSDDD